MHFGICHGLRFGGMAAEALLHRANAVQELLPVLLPTETRDQRDQFWGLEKVKTPRSGLPLAKLQCWGITSWCR